MTGHVKRFLEDFKTGSSGFLGVSPSGLVGRIAWSNFHVLRNVRSFYECCDKCFCVLMLDVHKYSSERHKTGFS